MKKVLAFALVVMLFVSLGVTAYAATAVDQYIPPNNNPQPAPAGGNAEPVGRYRLYNAEDELIGTVPATEVLKVNVTGVWSLNKEDGDKFMKYYNKSKLTDDRKVKFFMWVDIPESYKTDDLAYMTFPFDCEGKDVQAVVNGEAMVVDKLDTGTYKYECRMADFGALMVTRAK